MKTGWWDFAANAFCPGEGARDNSCSSSGSLSSKGLKIETDDDPSTNWVGKYKVGGQSFTSKKEATAFIKQVEEAESLGPSINLAELTGLDKVKMQTWAKVHLPGYQKAGIDERAKMLKEHLGKLKLEESNRLSRREDGTEKTVFDRWADSAKEWEDVARRSRDERLKR